MRKRFAVLGAVMTAVMALLCIPGMTRAEQPAEPQDEWTVMFYFCGSDLESKYGYASLNMQDMLKAVYPYNLGFVYTNEIPEDFSTKYLLRDIGRVNILIETGGAREWHTEQTGMDVSSKALQRWRLNYYDTGEENQPENGFELLENLPLRSMSDPDTLTDFIRWGVRTYPAKKYALVLWDHGGGAKSGLFVDELYDGSIMHLKELKQALADSGVYLEALVIDACLMANIETAWAVRDHAHWMVASEETVPGKGTAVGDWLQALINHPALDGEWLGRCICDTTGNKYANEDDEMAISLLTWSVIDLTKIEQLIRAADHLFQLLGQTLEQSPDIAKAYSRFISQAEEYGDRQNMRDFGSVIYNPKSSNFVEPALLDEAIKALSEAVVYLVRGPGRSEAHGLSFCYPAGCSHEELDDYARNFPLASYLAYLDAISTWSAPEWVYEQTERLRELDTIEELQITIEKRMASDGMPALDLGTTSGNLDDLYYRLYRLDEDTGEILRLGMTDCGIDSQDEDLLWRATDPLHWPAIDGVLCCMDLVRYTGMVRLYDIPVQINSDTSILRLGRSYVSAAEGNWLNEYEIYGVWEGYEANSEVANRNVKPLAMMSGRRYRLLYPKEGTETDGRVSYAMGPEMTMYRALDIEEIMLPPGTYYLEYELRDMFSRSIRLDRIEMHWDGQNLTFSEGFVWEGTAETVWE